MENIHERIDEISELIKNRPCYSKLGEQVDLMESNEEVIVLANVFEKAQREYSDGLKHYEDDSEELKKLYENLLIAKNNLDSHPVVLDYYDLLQEVNEPLNYLQFKLISLFKTKTTYTCGK